MDAETMQRQQSGGHFGLRGMRVHAAVVVVAIRELEPFSPWCSGRTRRILRKVAKTQRPCCYVEVKTAPTSRTPVSSPHRSGRRDVAALTHVVSMFRRIDEHDEMARRLE
jgi:hypothetical protein